MGCKGTGLAREPSYEVLLGHGRGPKALGLGPPLLPMVPGLNQSPLARRMVLGAFSSVHVLPNSPVNRSSTQKKTVNRSLPFRACNCVVWPTGKNVKRTW